MKAEALPYDLVIFDCDGVLIDSEVLACRIDSEVLTEGGFPISATEIARRFVGRSAAHMFAELEADFGRPLSEGLRGDLQARLNAALAREVEAMPGIHELLDRLAMPLEIPLGIPACVASSSDPVRLEASLGRVGLYERFRPHVYSAVQVERGKPAPDLFLLAASRLEVAPGRCVVVEDSPAGVAAGVAAGMTVIGFTGGGHCGPEQADRLRSAGAGVVVSSMQALQPVLFGSGT